MKKLVVTPLSNTIWWATVNEEKGTMDTNTRVDVTDNAIGAVLEHLMNMEDFKTNGLAGYEYNTKNNSTVSICAVQKDKVVCVNRKYYEKLLKIKAMYEGSEK